MTFIDPNAERCVNFGSNQNNRRMEVSDANFGAYDRDTFSVSFWFRPNTNLVSGTFCVMSHWHSSTASDQAFNIRLTKRTIGSAYTIQVQTGTASGNANKVVSSPTLPSSGTTWNFVVVHFDLQNATANQRVRVFVDGSEASYAGTSTNPAQESLNNSTVNVMLGANNANSPTQYLAARLYEPAFYNGVLIDSVTSYYTANEPVAPPQFDDTNLFMYFDGDAGQVNTEWVNTQVWTNIGGTAVATTIPQQQ